MTTHEARLLWLEPDWLALAEEWIRAQLARCGIARTGNTEQIHVRWWSTILRVPTSEGDLFFKANAPPAAFEPALTEFLAHVDCDRIPELVAIDRERAWMLMRDAGTRLRELMKSVADLRRWQELLPLYAELQIAIAPRAHELLAIGVPDARLKSLPADFEQLLADACVLRVGVPEGLTPDEHAQLAARIPAFREVCGKLAAYGIPETLQHDDFHDGNVFVRDGRYLFLDWGDSCVSHPFHTLAVTLRSIAFKLGVEPGGPELERLRDAYVEPFTRYRPHKELVEAVDLAHRSGTVARSLAWYRFVTAMEPPFRDENAESVSYGLKRFLAGGPLGSWS
jgi:hypothetical protein